MKRHTVLAALAAPLLALSVAVAAQAAAPDDSNGGAEAATIPSETELPVEPSDTPDTTSGPTTLPDEVAPDPSPSVSSSPEATATAEPTAPPAVTNLPEPIAPEHNTTQPPADPDLRLADVLISFAATDVVPGAVVVSGYLAEVESGGVCTLTLTRGAEKFVVEDTAEPDATTTVCGGLTMSTAGLARGTWAATLSYVSDTQAGISSPTNVTVA